MRQEVRWTDLTYEQIAEHLAEAGTPVSVPVASLTRPLASSVFLMSLMS